MTNGVTGLLAFVAILGAVYMWQHRHVRDGHYKLLGWSALATVCATVWVGRMLHEFVEPRSLIAPFQFVGWTMTTIFVTTLFIVTVRKHRRSHGLD